MYAVDDPRVPIQLLNSERGSVSLDAQDWVWQHSSSKGTARLVLLAIADKANGADCSAYAGTTMLVRRTNAARSSVVVAVDKLIEAGELAVVDGRRGPKGETVYSLPQACGHRRSTEEGGPKSGPVQNPDPSENRTPGGPETRPLRSEIRTPTGPKSGPHNAVNAEKPSRTQRGAQASENDSQVAPIDTDGFALTDAMRRWAIETFGNALDIDYETAQFIDHHRAEGRRRNNWPAEWQKWMRRSAKWASERANRPPLRSVSGSGQHTTDGQPRKGAAERTADLFAEILAEEAAQ